jgi:chemotaxis protein CheD
VEHTVGISQMKVSNRADDVLATYSLGSCIALSVYDPAVRVGGLIHAMLPLSKIDPAKARTNPHMFVDTGVPALLQAVFDLGAEPRRLVAKVAGAASLLDEKGMFRIGQRNCAVLRKVLRKNRVLIAGEDVGGSAARSMYLHMATGQTFVKSQGRVAEL